MANIDIKPSKIMPNLLHTLPAYASKDDGVLNAIVEINANSRYKFEMITESGHVKLDRVGYSTLVYPLAYGLIPRTWDLDGDMLDIVIAGVDEPLPAGCLVEARVVGIIKFIDGGEEDDKVVAVLNDDKRMDHIKSLEDLGPYFQKEVGYYFEHYKDLKKPGTCEVKGFEDVTSAHKTIVECEQRYVSDYEPKLA
jgi:inorganic pyrophosphatase